jgi:cation diffusion facilitator CzcD-associated flavoprotein CzcO
VYQLRTTVFSYQPVSLSIGCAKIKMQAKSVAIVGAGAAGLVAAKVLLEDGFNVTLFDRQRQLGGVWNEESAYADLHTQQPGGTMEFADLFDGQGKSHSYSMIYHLRFM